MKLPPAFLCAIIAFACLLPLNAAAFARQQAPSALDKAIQTAEDEIQKLQDFIKDPSISNSLRAGLEPVLKNRKERLEDLKKLRSMPVQLRPEELQNVIATLNAAPAGAPTNERREDPERPPMLDGKPLSQAPNVISGSGVKPGAQVEVFVNNESVGATTSSAGGTYKLNVPDLNPSDHVKVKQTYTRDDGQIVTDFFSNEKIVEEVNSKRGTPVGYLLGGIVMSQQSKEFSQADPFFGFVGGYRFGLLKKNSDGKQPNPFKRGQWNVRFQGVFQADGRAATDKDALETAARPKFDPFIVSRKTFNIETQLWWDFKIGHNVLLGPYGAWGGSTALSKNETQGETTSVDGDQPINIGDAAKIDNDMKQYKEYGMRMNVFLFNRNLYLQSILARGNYEALKGLAPNVDSNGNFIGHHNTQRRFIGKLMIVPEGLSNTFGQQKNFTPMFGVEVNAGYGPDQLKFFFGSIIRIKGLTQ